MPLSEAAKGHLATYHKGKEKTGNTLPIVFGADYAAKLTCSRILECLVGKNEELGNVLRELEDIVNAKEDCEGTPTERITQKLSDLDRVFKTYPELEDKHFREVFEGLKAQAAAAEEGFAGGWLTSGIEQVLQLYVVLSELKPKKMLRLGTASGYHAEQLVRLISMANFKPSLKIIDVSETPIKHTEQVAKIQQWVGNLMQELLLEVDDARTLETVEDGSIDLMSSHFTFRFIPNPADYDAGTDFESEVAGINLDETRHQTALVEKDSCLCRIYDKLASEGAFVACIDTLHGGRGWKDKEEMIRSYVKAGFKEEDIFCYDTANCMQYNKETGKHEKGVYFVYAIKRSTLDR